MAGEPGAWRVTWPEEAVCPARRRCQIDQGGVMIGGEVIGGAILQDGLAILIVVCGIFTTVLGMTHFIYPRLFQYRSLIYVPSNEGRELKPFQLWFITYPLTIDKVYALIWLMNNHVSFVLVSIGLVDLLATTWLLHDARYLLLWIGVWWWLRAGFQPFLGWHPRDWFWFSVFAALGVVHLWAGLR
jgi:hypothetical protein